MLVGGLALLPCGLALGEDAKAAPPAAAKPAAPAVKTYPPTPPVMIPGAHGWTMATNRDRVGITFGSSTAMFKTKHMGQRPVIKPSEVKQGDGTHQAGDQRIGITRAKSTLPMGMTHGVRVPGWANDGLRKSDQTRGFRRVPVNRTIVR
jgi:hypothetical protein